MHFMFISWFFYLLLRSVLCDDHFATSLVACLRPLSIWKFQTLLNFSFWLFCEKLQSLLQQSSCTPQCCSYFEVRMAFWGLHAPNIAMIIMTNQLNLAFTRSEHLKTKMELIGEPELHIIKNVFKVFHLCQLTHWTLLLTDTHRCQRRTSWTTSFVPFIMHHTSELTNVKQVQVNIN